MGQSSGRRAARRGAARPADPWTPAVTAQPSPGGRSFSIDVAGPADVPDVHALIGGLADYEGLSGICVATHDDLARALFGEQRCAEVLIARPDTDSTVAAGFALYFHTYSTF